MTEPAVEPIPQAELDRSRRKLCRRIAAALVRGMAETDTDFATIAARTGRSERSVRDYLRALIEGLSGLGLDMISDFAWAMGGEIEFHIVKRAEADAAPAPSPERGC